MGKIRVKTLGDEEAEKKKREKKEAKKAVKKAEKGDAVEETKGTEETKVEQPKEKVQETKKPKSPSSPKSPKKVRSQKYQSAKMLVDPAKRYALKEALELLPKIKLSKFDETVELHINVVETGISGNLTLPHGTGKKTRVAVADDALIAQIEQGKIDFDMLVAEPSMMLKLAKVAKFLGPRGLMPSPKAGTVTDKPQDVVKKYEGGQMRFKTETKAPVIHLTVGKLSFGDKKLSENIQTVIQAVQPGKITKLVLKSTMSPAIKLNPTSL